MAEEVPSNTSHEIQIIEIDSHPAEEEPSAGETEMLSTVKSKNPRSNSIVIFRERIFLSVFTLP
jgi:hypothetical protein